MKNDSSDPFLQLLGAYQNAVHAKDVNAFVAIYDEDLHVFDMWGTWSLRGLDAWRTMAEGWFSSLGNEQVLVGFKEVQTTEVGELAIGHAILTYTAVSAEGKELRSLNNRITVALRKTGHLWKIFHEHTSAPIDHQSMKAILQPTDNR